MTRQNVWLDQTHASKWDADPLSSNPQRGEQLDLLLSLITDHYLSGTTILDVGCGSGLVEEKLFRQLPEALVLGVDYSPPMIAMARERLAGKAKQFEIVQHDFNAIDDLRLPVRHYQVAFSVQAIHNLAPANQRKVISWVRRELSHPGFFFLLDRIAVPSVELFSSYRSFWNHQEKTYSVKVQEGQTPAEHRRLLEEEGDSPMTLQENLMALAESGFHASPLEVHGNRALFVCSTCPVP
jgi:SAM-dependent methyltransferase